VAVAADNAASLFTKADMQFCVGVVDIPVATYKGNATMAVCTLPQAGLFCQTDNVSLYGQLMCIGAPTYGTTSDLTVQLSIEDITD